MSSATQRPQSGFYEVTIPTSAPAQGTIDFNMLPTAILVVDPRGVVLFANKRACATLGRTKGEVEGSTIDGLLAPLAVLLANKDGHEDKHRVALELPSGKRAIIGYSIGEIESGDAAYSVALKDITETERMREERDRLLQIATVNEVLPAMLHELKNPLAAVVASTELLVEEAPDEHVRSVAHAILQEIRRAVINLDGIGAVGRRLRASRHAPIDHAIQEVCSVLDARARARGIALRCTTGAMPLLPFDPAVVRAILFNLVNNAIQACRAGDSIQVSYALVSEGAELRVDVEDTGPGMTPEVLARCRDLFFTTKPNGNGLGLALCSRTVADADGAFEVDSALGRGTRITFHVPTAGL